MNWALLSEAVLEHRESKKLTVREADEESGVCYVVISRANEARHAASRTSSCCASGWRLTQRTSGSERASLRGGEEVNAEIAQWRSDSQLPRLRCSRGL